ncbi:transcription initiation factor TFIID subunit 8 [Carica papaya]|uniref:transcription initiation factor TFIID subunit 8 n=1 Tax=Carica papaya TaxID=3649 RepID=UPI000B8CBFBC|nr:transcription initiation factor TFIID subunit 8 [Carica papaya]
MRKNAKAASTPAIHLPATPSDFSFTLTRTAVSQICRSIGFKTTQFSALETLTLIASKYLQTLAKWASSCSHASARTESNLQDIVNALHDISSLRGFSGASDLQHCPLRSTLLKNLSSFVTSTAEIPFAQPIPRAEEPDIPIGPATANVVDNKRGAHIPSWLPAFPFPAGGTCNGSDDLAEEKAGLVLQSGGVGGILPKDRERVRFEVRRLGVQNGAYRGRKRVLRPDRCSTSGVNGGSIIQPEEKKKKRNKSVPKRLRF